MLCTLARLGARWWSTIWLLACRLAGDGGLGSYQNLGSLLTVPAFGSGFWLALKLGASRARTRDKYPHGTLSYGARGLLVGDQMVCHGLSLPLFLWVAFSLSWNVLISCCYQVSTSKSLGVGNGDQGRCVILHCIAAFFVHVCAYITIIPFFEVHACQLHDKRFDDDVSDAGCCS